MPRKSAMRENIAAVRTRVPHLASSLSREQIELALLYYDSNVDATVEAFQRDGAMEALSGWTETSHPREHNSSRRISKTPQPSNHPLPAMVSPSNAPLRPSQRVSTIFQIFAEGGKPNLTVMNGHGVASTPSSTVSMTDQSESHLSTSDLNGDFSINHSQSNCPVMNGNGTVDEIHHEEKPRSPQRRASVKNRHGSTSSSAATITNNRKLLTKSSKDLQRQTSTLANVEILFNNEIKSSLKRIDEVFKQMHDILKEREVELYLQMDKVKAQGLNVIHRRQQRGVELRQRLDRCDRMEAAEIDVLRQDIKQFVTDRRYDLGEELTSSHRFEFDQHIIDSLKNFGHVLTVDRKHERTQSISTSSPVMATTTTTETVNETEQPLPQRVLKKPTVNSPVVHSEETATSTVQINGYHTNGNGHVNGAEHRPLGKPTKPRVNMYHKQEEATYRRSRPRPTVLAAQSPVPVQS